MRRAVIRLVVCGALVCLTAAAAPAQTTTTSETKKFQIISVDGNTLVVKLPEGTREMAVADDFRFNVEGKMLSVQELRPGMSSTATITTRTTVTPVVVTEVKNGTVMQNLGTSILVRTESGIKMFSQADIDKRGMKIWREGKLAEISDFRANDKLTATIVTTKPPRVMTEREVNATVFVGVAVRTPSGRAVHERMEMVFFERLPGYGRLRSLTQRLAGDSEEIRSVSRWVSGQPLRQFHVVRRDSPGVAFLPPEQTQDWCVAGLSTKPERHAEGLPVFERQGIGRHGATGAGVTFDGVAKCSRKAGDAEHVRVRLVHHPNRRVEWLGSLDDCFQIA